MAIQTLKDFQYIEEQKDQGASVREKAKQLVNLLRDDERLKAERAKAFKARERFAQNAMGIGSDNKMVFASRGVGNRPNSSYADPYGGAAAGAVGGAAAGAEGLAPELEAVRPSDQTEEELQIKLAIMLSQQEHDEEVQRKRADEAKLAIALEQSKSESQPNGVCLVDCLSYIKRKCFLSTFLSISFLVGRYQRRSVGRRSIGFARYAAKRSVCIDGHGTSYRSVVATATH